jgi:chromosome segregation ATPase
MAEIEGQLAEALEALAVQQQESEENATSYAQAMARLSHSERTLGQTKSRLMDAEERIEKSEARGAALGQQLGQLELSILEQRAAFDREAQEERERAVRQTREEAAAELNVREMEITRLQRVLEAAHLRDLEQSQLLETLRAQNEAKAGELDAAHEWTSRALAQEKSLRDLSESLSRDSADGAAECARLSEHLKAVEEREQRALARALTAESEHSSSSTELSETKRREAELTERRAELEQARDAALARLASSQATVVELEAGRALDQQELASAEHERARFIGILGALEMLGREIVDVGFQARKAAEPRSKSKLEDAESDRTTLKPEPAPRHQRSSTAPEITIDGVRLDP